MIRLEDVSFAYAEGKPIFEHFDWQVERNQAWAVVGPSGCGKTTLLYLLAGLRFPQLGSVQVDGAELTRSRPQTGLVLQDYGLLPWATVLENVMIGLKIRNLYGPDGTHAPSQTLHAADGRSWLKQLGIAELEKQYPGSLSGGQRQRVAIARTMVLQPDLLLMDEPFSSLDAPARSSMQLLTRQLWQKQHFTLVVVTHSIEEAAALGKTILLLGQAPNQQAQVLENPVFGMGERSLEIAAFCDDLRGRLEGL